MKRVKVLIASALFCAMGYAGFIAHEKMTMPEAEKLMTANIEALTDNESGGETTHCRCHDDGQCYVGNAISFRSSCVKLKGSDACHLYAYHCPPSGIL